MARPARRRSRARDGRMPAQTSTNGCPVTSTSGPATVAARRCSFEPGTRWSTSTPRRRRGAGRERPHSRGELVDAVHRFDDDGRVAEVVAPHQLEQLGVVAALDPDAAGRGDAGRGARPGDRARGGEASGRGRVVASSGGAPQGHRSPVEAEAALLPTEVALVLVTVAQRHRLRRPPHDVAAVPAGPVLDHHAQLDLDLRVAGCAVGVGELVEDVALVGHDRSACQSGVGQPRTRVPRGSKSGSARTSAPTSSPNTSTVRRAPGVASASGSHA